MLGTIEGVIRRRVLINYRADPSVIRPLVPDTFGLTTVDGWAIAGVCLIRLERMRPAGLPVGIGFASESAAYRVTVTGPSGDAVYVLRRDTTSRLQALAGGRLFPASFGRCTVDAADDGPRLDVQVRSENRRGDVRIAGSVTDALPGTSAFSSLPAASRFLERGSVGWSPRAHQRGFDRLELNTETWSLAPLAVDRVESACYDDRRRFPTGSIAFDSALVMRDVPHRWRRLAAG